MVRHTSWVEVLQGKRRRDVSTFSSTLMHPRAVGEVSEVFTAMGSSLCCPYCVTCSRACTSVLGPPVTPEHLCASKADRFMLEGSGLGFFCHSTLGKDTLRKKSSQKCFWKWDPSQLLEDG
ncbi:hypothetical protein LEMLEM_LOCUS10420 [Lemmus lemmus]